MLKLCSTKWSGCL